MAVEKQKSKLFDVLLTFDSKPNPFFDQKLYKNIKILTFFRQYLYSLSPSPYSLPQLSTKVLQLSTNLKYG